MNSPPDESLPADFGKYRLEKRIAAGGMAEVFLAHRHDAPHEPLVIKRILPHISQDKNFVQMFTDEARMAANLDHPNVVRILDLGLIEGAYFLAMEYVHGEDIRRIYNRAYKLQRSLPLSHSIRVIADAAQGLAYAHKLQDSLTGEPMGLVHRDVSPQNILVTYAGDAKVVDFGIAKASHKVQQTRAGQLKGKYSYMSPEQALGDPIDHRTDIFALGIILYETTTGTRLFKRHNELATLQAVMKCEFVLPHEALPNYPADLEALVVRALAKSPEARWQDAAAFSAALYDFLYDSGLYVDREQVGAFMRDLFADYDDPAPDEPAEPAAQAHDRPGRADPVLPERNGQRSGDADPVDPIDRPDTDASDPQPSPEARRATVAARGRRPAISAEDDDDLDDQTARGSAPAEPPTTRGDAPGFARAGTDAAIGEEHTRSDSIPQIVDPPDLSNQPVRAADDERRKNTMLVRERLTTGIDPASGSWPDDAAPTVAEVPSYRMPEPHAPREPVPTSFEPPSLASAPPNELKPVLAPSGVDPLPVGRPARSVPAYTGKPIEPEASSPRRPAERTQQVRARRAHEVLEDTRQAFDPPSKPRTPRRKWSRSSIAIAGTLAVTGVLLLSMVVAGWFADPGRSRVIPVADPPQASLTIVTEPGAAVIIDGQRLGNADADGQAGPFRVAAGQRQARVQHSGTGFDRSRSVSLQPNQNYHFEIRGRTGWLRLSVTPWAQVSIDGKPMGLSPLPRIGLLEGLHEIRLENPDIGKYHEAMVRIEPGREAEVRVDLERSGRQL